MNVYVFHIDGLHCAVCAGKIERELQNEKRFQSAQVDLMAQKITLHTEEKMASAQLTAMVDEKIKMYEKGVQISLSNQKEKTYTLKNLHCQDCAAKIERSILKLPDVEAVRIDLMQGLLYVSWHGSQTESEIFESLKNTIGQIESQVILGQKEKKKEKNREKNKDMLFFGRFILSGIIFLLLLTLFRNHPMKLFIALASYFIIGYDVIYRAFLNITKGRVLDEHFLMTFATIGAFAIGEYPEAIAVMLFYQIGEWFQERAVDKSKDAIHSVVALKSEMANVIRGGQVASIPTESVQVGEMILVRPGELVPLDGYIMEGESILDTKAITGEPLPISAMEGDYIHSGVLNQTAGLKIKVDKTYQHSTVGKILEMVQNSTAKKAKTEKMLTRIAAIYTPLVVAMAFLLTLVPTLVWGMAVFQTWFHRSLIFLVISCPCALVISIPLTYFAGIGACAKNGILVKGSTYLDALHESKIAIFDKTGTLTEGHLKIADIHPAEGFSKEDVMQIAKKIEAHSNHPIAKAIMESGIGANPKEIGHIQEFAGHGAIALGAEEQKYAIGKWDFLRDHNFPVGMDQYEGTVVYVAAKNQYIGAISLSDQVKETAKTMISSLRRDGVQKLFMLTGDGEKSAKEVAQHLKLNGYLSRLLPDEKVKAFEEIKQREKAKVLYVGDGINDAPLLAAADVGISLGQFGQDAAIEASDIVIMEEDLGKLHLGKKIAKSTRKIIVENITFVFFIKILVMVLGALGIANMWSAIFADVGVSLIAILNAIRILRKNYEVA